MRSLLALSPRRSWKAINPLHLCRLEILVALAIVRLWWP